MNIMRKRVTTTAAAVLALMLMAPVAAHATGEGQSGSQQSVYEIAAQGDTPTTDVQPRAVPAAVAVAAAGARAFTAASLTRQVTMMAKNASLTKALFGMMRTESGVGLNTEVASAYFDR